MWRRILVLVALLLLLPGLLYASMLTQFQATFPTAAILQVRNVSSQPVFVELGSPTNGFFGWFKGVSYQRIEVDPWQAGWCSALRLGVIKGVESVTVSGSAVQGQPAYAWNVPTFVGGDEVDLNVLVDSAGATVFAGKLPADDGSCMGYPEGLDSNGG
jgi:hypothetical protein